MLYIGACGTGIGLKAYAKLQLKAALEPPTLNVYAQVIRGVGTTIQVAYCEVMSYGPTEFAPTVSYVVKSFPLTGKSDPDVIALSGQTVDVKWYYFRASSGLWYTVTCSGNVLALKSVSETFTGGILWKPINN